MSTSTSVSTDSDVVPVGFSPAPVVFGPSLPPFVVVGSGEEESPFDILFSPSVTDPSPSPLSSELEDVIKTRSAPLAADANLQVLPEGGRLGNNCVSVALLRFGLSFPFPPLLDSIFQELKTPPAQLHPNAIVVVFGFLEQCLSLGVPPSLPLFRSFYFLAKTKTPFIWTFIPRYKVNDFLVGKQDSVKGYRGSWYCTFNTSVYPVPEMRDVFVSEKGGRYVPDDGPLPIEVEQQHQLLSGRPLALRSYYRDYSYQWSLGVYSERMWRKSLFFCRWLGDDRLLLVLIVKVEL